METQEGVYTCSESEEEPEIGSSNKGQQLDQDPEGASTTNVSAPHVRQVYLITYSQANLEHFPTRRSFAECVVETFNVTGAGVMQWACCREEHRDEGEHYHLAVKLERIRRLSAVKTLLQEKHGISVHFSNTHNNYYSAWKYVTKEDEEVLQSANHPNLWNSKPPRTDKACEKRSSIGRTRSSANATDEGPSKPTKRKRLSAFELSEIILERGIKTRTELLALAQEQKEEGKTDIAEFVVNRGAGVVAEVIDTAWEMKHAKDKLERSQKSRMEILEEVLAEECVADCNGNWYYSAHETLEKNGIEKSTFANAVLDLLDKGRGKYRNIMIVGPANCGKTFMLNPLNKVFHTFCNPATTTFAWVGAEKAECIFLNDFRWSPQVISWHDILLMLEGQQVHIPAPKTHYANDLVFDKDTQIFATGKRTMVYIKNGSIDEKETEMLSVRWKVFYFNNQFNEGEQRDIPVCGKCFAAFILNSKD